MVKLTHEQRRPIEAAIEAIAAVPRLYLDGDVRIAKRDQPVTPEQVRGAFEGVERGYAYLGPRTADEPTMPYSKDKTELYSALCQELYHRGEPSVERWFSVIERWSQQHAPDAIIPMPEVTWHGLFRHVVRGSLSGLAILMFHQIAVDVTDRIGMREYVFQKLPEMVLLIDDSSRGLAVNALVRMVGDRAIPLATEVYHHPTSGPDTKAAIEAIVEDDILEHLRNNPPESHRPIPWQSAPARAS